MQHSTHRDSGKNREHPREDLAGEHKYGDAGQLILAFIFTLTWVCDTFIFELTTFLNQVVPLMIRLPLGFAVLALSAWLARRTTAIVFGEKRETPVVIRKGVYGVVRHPMYLSEVLLYFGFLVLSLSLAAAFIWIIAIFFLHGISKYEEKLCLLAYGEAYERYMSEVPRWIPRFRKSRI